MPDILLACIGEGFFFGCAENCANQPQAGNAFGVFSEVVFTQVCTPTLQRHRHSVNVSYFFVFIVLSFTKTKTSWHKIKQALRLLDRC